MQYQINSTLLVGDRLYHAGEVEELDLTPEQIEHRLEQGIITAVTEEVTPPPVEEKKAKKPAIEALPSN